MLTRRVCVTSYVKKTAAMCVAKLFDISPSMVRDQGFLDQLRELICDANPMVVANAVAALSEILSDRDVLELTTTVLQKLLAALNECSEWGQVFILDFLAKFTPGDAAQAENIIERVLPRLKHSNSAVVLSAVKIVMRYLEIISNKETVSRFCRKLSPPLVTLSQSPQSEIQYVALRNINLVVQKRPDLLVHKIKVFFCKYNDPIYVKMEKLEILVRLASERNIDQLLQELKEYASEVDVDFVRKSVSTIGRCAIKLERAAERCIKVLLQLIQTEVNYVVQEAVVVIKNIFRKYPNRYESVIGVLCDALDTLDEPEAKASMVWIIGEYSNRIENADELLETFLETFDDEPPMVQLQLLTATVKLFLRRPSKGKDMVQAVLTQATENSDNPDLRDRGYVYWRLLSCDPAGAKDVVLAEKPVISDDTNQLEESQLNDLIGHIATLSSIYHKSPEEIITKKVRAEEDDDLSDGSSMYSSDGEDETKTPTPGTGAGAGAGGGPAAPVEDLLGLGFGDTAAPAAPTSAAPPAAPAGGLGDLFGTPAPAPPAVPPAAPAATASSSSAGAPKLLGSDFGLAFKGRFVRQGGNTVFQVQLQNSSSAPVSTCSLSMNKNLFGLTATSAVVTFNAAPGASALAAVPCTFSNTHFQPGATSLALDIAVRNDSVPSQVIFFKGVEVPLTALLSEDGAIAREQYVPTWGSLAASVRVLVCGGRHMLLGCQSHVLGCGMTGGEDDLGTAFRQRRPRQPHQVPPGLQCVLCCPAPGGWRRSSILLQREGCDRPGGARTADVQAWLPCLQGDGQVGVAAAHKPHDGGFARVDHRRGVIIGPYHTVRHAKQTLKLISTPARKLDVRAMWGLHRSRKPPAILRTATLQRLAASRSSSAPSRAERWVKMSDTSTGTLTCAAAALAVTYMLWKRRDAKPPSPLELPADESKVEGIIRKTVTHIKTFHPTRRVRPRYFMVTVCSDCIVVPSQPNCAAP